MVSLLVNGLTWASYKICLTSLFLFVNIDKGEIKPTARGYCGG